MVGSAGLTAHTTALRRRTAWSFSFFIKEVIRFCRVNDFGLTRAYGYKYIRILACVCFFLFLFLRKTNEIITVPFRGGRLFISGNVIWLCGLNNAYIIRIVKPGAYTNMRANVLLFRNFFDISPINYGIEFGCTQTN